MRRWCSVEFNVMLGSWLLDKKKNGRECRGVDTLLELGATIFKFGERIPPRNKTEDKIIKKFTKELLTLQTQFYKQKHTDFNSARVVVAI